MADSVITEPNGAAVTLAGWQNVISKLTKQSKGLAALSFDSYADGATAPSVVAGGIYEINGTYYQVDSDTLITGMSTVSTSYYIYSTSGTWSSSTTAPAWDEARNGWYLSTDANARCFFKVTTDSGGEYDGRCDMANTTSIDLSRTEINGVLNLNRVTHTFIRSSSFTEGDLFDWLTNYLPTVGDIAMISGGVLYSTTAYYIFSHAERTTSSQIRMYCLVRNIGGSIVSGSVSASSGSGFAYAQASICILK